MRAGRASSRSEAVLELEVRPPWPYRLPARMGADRVARRRRDVLSRLLAVAGAPVVVHAWQPARDRVVLRAVAADERGRAGREALELAIERMRFALVVDEDLTEFARAFRGDPLIGAAIHQRPWQRPRRRPWPWEALAWAVTEQLIEVSRAAGIQRRIVRRWGDTLLPAASSASRPGAAGSGAARSASRPGAAGSVAARSASRPGAAVASGAWNGPGPLRDVPSARVIAGRAPAELAAMDLAPKRALALIRCAREVAAGRVDPSRADDDRRLLTISEIGPWTVQILGYAGRGDPDSLPAGDLAFVKLVGGLAGLGRRATAEEVEEFFAPYAPFRALAGTFALARWRGAVAQGPPLRAAA